MGAARRAARGHAQGAEGCPGRAGMAHGGPPPAGHGALWAWRRPPGARPTPGPGQPGARRGRRPSGRHGRRRGL
eukprot:6350832-Lingulodinium_polyedra.AAC.1